MQQHGADQRQASAHFDLGDLSRHALAFGHAVVGLPKVAVTVVLLHVDNRVVVAFAQAQAELFDTFGDHLRAAEQRWQGQSFVHHNLGCAQHALFFAFGIGNALFQCLLGQGEDRLHDRARGVDKTLQFLAVGVHVLDGSRCHAAVKCRLRHGGCNFHHETRVEGFGNQVLRTECQCLAGIGGSNDLALFGLRQFGNGMDRRNFHFHCDGGSPGIKGAAEDVREAQDVINLVRVVGATSRHDRVVAHRLDFFRGNFRCWVRQRKNQRPRRHLFDHIGLEHATGGQAKENVGTCNHLAQCAGIGFLRVDDLVFVHQFGAAFIDHAGQISDKNVLAPQSQFEQKAQASQRRRAGARGHQLDIRRLLAGDFQTVEDGRADRDGGAMLIIMKDRNLHAFAQLAFDIKAVGRLDVFQIDAAKSWLQ